MPTIRSFRLLASFSLLLWAAAEALAGPPFRTDDPQPVAFRHWEFYVASMQQFAAGQSSATLPHFEINYGVIPGVQLHVVAPLGYVHDAGATHYGYADTELGVKYRFVEETESVPQVGVFPLVEFPTGDETKQLGAGKVQAYLPLWAQKSWGPWTTYGGGGFWYLPGEKNSWFTGWELQYDVSEAVTFGGELCYQSDAGGGISFTMGGYVNFDAEDHLLLSVGHSLSGPGSVTGYVGFQLTI